MGTETPIKRAETGRCGNNFLSLHCSSHRTTPCFLSSELMLLFPNCGGAHTQRWLKLSHGLSQSSLCDTVNENCVCWDPDKFLVGWFLRIGCAVGNTAFLKAGIDFAPSVQGVLLRSVQAEPGFWRTLLYSSCSSQGERSLLTAPQTPPTARTVLDIITFLSTLRRELVAGGWESLTELEFYSKCLQHWCPELC